MNFFWRAILFLTGFVLILTIAAHLILSYKAKEILQEIVSKASKQKYLLKADKVSFFYEHAGIEAKKVELIPVNQSPGQASLAFEKLEIRLSSIFHLLFRKNLEVLKIELIKPEIITYAKSNNETQKHGIPETIQKIQTTLLQSIEVLNVQDVNIADASLKIFSADTLSNSYLYINHINLRLNDIYFDQQVAESGEVLHLKGALILQKPTIHLPDSTISVSVSRLEANVTNRSLMIDTLDLRIKGKEDKQQQLKLSTLDVSHLHWERFLQEGIFELDTVLVNKGLADIHLANKRPSENTQAAKQPYDGATFIIHHTYISDIAYRLHTSSFDKMQNSASNISLKLGGDSLYLHEFSLLKDRQPAFEVENLKVGFRDFVETDDQKKLTITLAALTLDKNSLVLKNYLLETNKANHSKNYIRLAVPEFRLNNYDFEKILRKKITASSVQLINPDITIDLRQSKKQPKQNKDIDDVFSGLMQKVSGKASLEEISIENGSITFLTLGKEEDSIKINGLSLVLDAGKFPGIKTAHDFVLAIKRFDSKGFEIKGHNMQLAVKDMKLLTSPQGIFFGKIKGQFGEGRKVDLEGVTILLNEDMDYLHSHDIHASLVKIDRGIVQVDMPEGKKEKQHNKGNPPSIRADKLMMDNLVFKINKGEGLGISAALDIEGDDLNFDNGQLSWQKLGVSSLSADAFFGKTTFNTGAINIEQPGIISILHANGKSQTRSGNIDFSTERLDLELGLESTNFPSLAIEGISLVKPVLKISMGKNPSKTTFVKQAKSISKEISLKKLELQEPTIDFLLKDSAGSQSQQHRAFTGTFLIKDIHTFDEPEIKIGNISYATENPKSEFRKLILNPGSLQLSISDIHFNTLNKHYTLHVDSVVVKKIGQTIIGRKEDTLKLEADGIGAGNFNYEKGQKIQIETFLKSANWWTQNGQIRYHTPKQLIMAKGVHAKGGSTALLAVDSFSILNRASKEDIWKANAYEKGYETITGGKLQLSGIGITFPEKKPVIDIRKLSAQHLHFTTEKDKTKPEDTIDYRPLLTGMFTRMALPLKIDSVLLNNARVDAHEISKKTGKRTHIFFTNINGYLKNVKTWDIKEKDTLDMRMRAQFYGTDQLRLHFKQSYDDTLQGFWMRVRMSHFNMPEMNQLLTPLMGLKISSGTIDSLLLVANGNEYFAYGTMDLRYHDLHAKIAKTEDTKGKLLIGIENFFVNLILRNHDNGRTNLLFKERLRKRGIFNFWAKIGLEGLLSNLGIKWDKKEQKRFEESIDKYNLPEKYWEDMDDIDP